MQPAAQSQPGSSRSIARRPRSRQAAWRARNAVVRTTTTSACRGCAVDILPPVVPPENCRRATCDEEGDTTDSIRHDLLRRLRRLLAGRAARQAGGAGRFAAQTMTSTSARIAASLRSQRPPHRPRGSAGDSRRGVPPASGPGGPRIEVSGAAAPPPGPVGNPTQTKSQVSARRAAAIPELQGLMVADRRNRADELLSSGASVSSATLQRVKSGLRQPRRRTGLPRPEAAAATAAIRLLGLIDRRDRIDTQQRHDDGRRSSHRAPPPGTPNDAVCGAAGEPAARPSTSSSTCPSGPTSVWALRRADGAASAERPCPRLRSEPVRLELVRRRRRCRSRSRGHRHGDGQLDRLSLERQGVSGSSGRSGCGAGQASSRSRRPGHGRPNGWQRDRSPRSSWYRTSVDPDVAVTADQTRTFTDYIQFLDDGRSSDSNRRLAPGTCTSLEVVGSVIELILDDVIDALKERSARP